MMLFECHITLRAIDDDTASTVARHLNWKTSLIAGDPVLGKDVFFYLTTHDTDIKRLTEKMNDTVSRLRGAGANVVREKIELIVHDRRYDR